MTGGEINVSEERDFVTFLYVRRLQSIKEQKKKNKKKRPRSIFFVHFYTSDSNLLFLPLPPLKDVRERIHTRAHTLDTHIVQTLVGR